jgi:transposase
LTGLDPAQTLILPFNLDGWLRPNHPARGLADIIDQLDLSAIQPPHDPRMMVRIIAYGYSKGLRSSRRIEQALHDDIPMRWLSRNQQPDHSVIAECRRRHHEALGNLLVQTVQIAKSAGLVGGHDVAVDGTKFHANASKHSAMSYGYMVEEKRRLEEAVAKALEEMEAADQRDEREGDRAEADFLAADVKFKEARLAKIRDAMAAPEQRAKEDAEAKEAKRKATAEREGRTFVPKDLSHVRVEEKAQYNFTEPQSRIVRGQERRLHPGLQRPGGGGHGVDDRGVGGTGDRLHRLRRAGGGGRSGGLGERCPGGWQTRPTSAPRTWAPWRPGGSTP